MRKIRTTEEQAEMEAIWLTASLLGAFVVGLIVGMVLL